MSDNFEEFQQKYPLLFREYPRSGFDLPSGWEDLVHTLCQILETQIHYMPEEVRVEAYCAQIKEKFGGLRFYMNQETPEMSGAIRMAENWSFHICEACGQFGVKRTGGWIRTLCELHFEEQEKRNAKRNVGNSSTD